MKRITGIGGVSTLKVVEIKCEENTKARYLLLDENGDPVIPVIKFLKYFDNIGKAENTLKSYCYHLKLYFEFLHQKGIDYTDVNLEYLAEFIGWLRNPHQSTKVVSLSVSRSKRTERTVNTILNGVIAFYEYHLRSENLEKDITGRLNTKVSSRFKKFKPFLHHINSGKLINKNILKIKEPKRLIRTLSKEHVSQIYLACNNLRDRLLIRVLYEGGLRIGEALSLWIEDFNIDKNYITVRKSKTCHGENRKVFLSQETMNLFQDFLIEIHTEDVDTNYVFINLKGKNKGEQVKDWAVRSLIKRIRSITGIDFTPHMFRHTYATELHENNVEIAVIQKLLGHAQVQTTIQTYIHVTDKAARESWQNVQDRKGLLNETKQSEDNLPRKT